MLNAQDSRLSQRLDENKLKTLNEIALRINRVAISSAASLAAGATIGSVSYIALNSPVGSVLPGAATVIGGIVGGVAGALSLAVDVVRRNKSQDSRSTI